MSQNLSAASPSNDLPHLRLQHPFEDVLLKAGGAEDRALLEARLPVYLPAQRWFGFKDQRILSARLQDAIRLPEAPLPAYLALLRVELPERTEFFLLPLALARGDEARRVQEARPTAPLARVEEPGGDAWLLHDAAANPAFWLALMAWWQSGTPQATGTSRYVPHQDEEARSAAAREVRIFGGEQSNSSAVFDGRFYVKLYRRLEQGTHPEPELLTHLTHAGFLFAPRLHGTLLLERPERTFALGILQEAVPVETDGWTYARAMTTRFLERLATGGDLPTLDPPRRYAADVPAWLGETAPEMLSLARLLGRRTAELHRALAAADAPDLRPLPGSPDHTRAFVQRVREELALTRRSLDEHAGTLDAPPSPEMWRHGHAGLDRLAHAAAACPEIRVHGDYHLGQVVRSNGEFYLLDFEGEPTRSLDERRARDGSLRDVAGMLRSLEYAVLSAAREHPDDLPEGLALTLVHWCQAQLLQAYYATAGAAPFLPPPQTRRLFLWAYLLHKALYEVRYELSHRPAWTWLPLRGLGTLLAENAVADPA